MPVTKTTLGSGVSILSLSGGTNALIRIVEQKATPNGDLIDLVLRVQAYSVDGTGAPIAGGDGPIVSGSVYGGAADLAAASQALLVKLRNQATQALLNMEAAKTFAAAPLDPMQGLT